MSAQDLTLIIFCSLMLAVVLVVAVHVVKRLRYLSKRKEEAIGTLCVSDDGEIFSEFEVPVDNIAQRDYIYLKVHHVKKKEERT